MRLDPKVAQSWARIQSNLGWVYFRLPKTRPRIFLSYSCHNCNPFAERVSIAVKSQTGSDNRRSRSIFVEIGPPAGAQGCRIEDRNHATSKAAKKRAAT
jgi:hypothetical protein